MNSISLVLLLVALSLPSIYAQCQQSPSSPICNNHGTCQYPSQPSNITYGYNPLIEGICNCDRNVFEKDGRSSSDASPPVFCHGFVQHADGMKSYILITCTIIGVLYAALWFADTWSLILLAQQGELRINLRTVALSLLWVKFLLNILYFLGNPFNIHEIWSSTVGLALGVSAEPFIITAYNLVFLFLRDLSSRHLQRQFNSRVIIWTVVISMIIAWAVCIPTIYFNNLIIYSIATLIYVIFSSLFMARYSYKIIRTLHNTATQQHQHSQNDDISEIPIDIKQKERIRGSVSIPVKKESRHAIMQVARISLGSSIVWFLNGIILLGFGLRTGKSDAREYIMGFFAVEMSHIVWGTLIVMTFWPRRLHQLHNHSVADHSLVDTHNRSAMVYIKHSSISMDPHKMDVSIHMSPQTKHGNLMISTSPEQKHHMMSSPEQKHHIINDKQNQRNGSVTIDEEME